MASFSLPIFPACDGSRRTGISQKLALPSELEIMQKLSLPYLCFGLAMLGATGWIAWFVLSAYPLLWWPAAVLLLALVFVDLPVFCDFCGSPLDRTRRFWKLKFGKKTACPECGRHMEAGKE